MNALPTSGLLAAGTVEFTWAASTCLCVYTYVCIQYSGQGYAYVYNISM